MTILTIAVGALFVMTGGVKVVGLKQSLEIRDHFAMSPSLWRMVGTLETAGGIGVIVGLAWNPIRVAALIGLVLLMLGAIVSRIRVKDPVVWLVVDAATLALVVVTLCLSL